MKLMPRIRATGWLTGFFCFFLASCLVVIHVRLYHYAFDDAFIHFRVVRNLFETGNPYYNTNDMVKVSTSSGWIVFLTIPFGIANLINIENNFPLIISITNALILLCGLYVYTRIVEVLLKNRLSISKKLLFQVSFTALLLPSSIGLMETPFALLIAGLGIYLLIRSKPSGFALLGLATFFRVELFILIGLTILFVIVNKQFRLRQIIGYSLLGLIPFTIYDLYFYHTLMPHSIIAKSTIYSLTTFDILLYMFTTLPIILKRNNHILFGIISVTVLVTVIMTSWAVFREKKIIKDFWAMIFCLLSLGIIGIYVFGPALIFAWYTPLYMIPILVACFVCSFEIEFPRNITLIIPLIALFLLSAISIIRTFYASVYNPSAYYFFESGARVKTYLEVGSILNDEYPNATLLTSEIGGLGYAFEGQILDAVGLASPDALAFHPMEVPELRESGVLGAIPPEYVRSTMPDIIVSYDLFAHALLQDDIISQYNVIVIPAYLPEDEIYSEDQTIWGSKYLIVFIHLSLPVSERIYALGQ
ncbi:MAG: hypothetical protein ABIJ39_03130 [Chloroflexota bacterium]